jgi:hypothetical protein
MGMYDNIVCKVPLPGKRAAWQTPESVYQTKDTPDQYLSTYTIDADGFKDGDGKPCDFTGRIEFYGSNCEGSYGEVCYSSNGEDIEEVTYRATIVEGRVQGVVQSEFTASAGIKRVQEPLEEDRESPQENYNVPLVGKKVYVKYGGSERGFWAEVIAENDRKIALRVTTDDGLYTKVGDLRVEHRSFGNTMFFSEEAARGLGASRDAKYQRELARYREKQSLRGSGKDGG